MISELLECHNSSGHFCLQNQIFILAIYTFMLFSKNICIATIQCRKEEKYICRISKQLLH